MKALFIMAGQRIQRSNVHPIFVIIFSVVALLSFIPGILSALAQGSGNTVFVDFTKYFDSTLPSQFSEPHLTFSQSGAGLTRSWNGHLQIRDVGAMVTVDVDTVASS